MTVSRPYATLTLVVPCYNEALRLQPQRFLSFVDANPRVRLLMVNDGSTDETLIRLRALAARRPGRIAVLDLAQNAGKAEAVRTGLQRAIAEGAELTGYWDADLATPLELVGDFLRIADRHAETEVIFGSRRTMLGHRVNRTAGRRAVSRLCAGLARMAIGLPVADTQCGAKILRATPGLAAAVAQPFTAAWLFDVELFARIARAGSRSEAPHRFYELPLSEWTEVPGSKVTARVILRSGLRMLRLIAELRMGPRPAQAAMSGALRKAA
ncbi:glycosyltransferase [Roseibacterium sp. SDUM158016]|uniref:glycosyltransferase n=1 Tax=Roseicyclus sediminis TaxID=2980997 RepID=UPI0021CE2ABE|nr:glycosyltransferase [Roseibacterium sp. SDUM158016]MCU4655222.1 glycosyltransferase [Roseibacterium sp. SDUM158016]